MRLPRDGAALEQTRAEGNRLMDAGRLRERLAHGEGSGLGARLGAIDEDARAVAVEGRRLVALVESGEAVGLRCCDSGAFVECARCVLAGGAKVERAWAEAGVNSGARGISRDEAVRAGEWCETCGAPLVPLAWVVNPEDDEAVDSGEGSIVFRDEDDARNQLDELRADGGAWALYRVPVGADVSDDTVYQSAMDAIDAWEVVR